VTDGERRLSGHTPRRPGDFRGSRYTPDGLCRGRNFRLNNGRPRAKYERISRPARIAWTVIAQINMKLPLPFFRNHPLPALLALAMIPAGALVAQTDAPATNGTPRIQFEKLIHDFDKIVGGQSVRHDYYFTNTGTALLKITSVVASCGCTTAGEWTREVAPGGVGQIPLQFNSGNFSGVITKTATVGCNDPATPSLTLQFKGTVWRPVEVAPTVAMLSVNSELVSNATAVVRVTNHASEPLHVFEPSSSNPLFAAEIRTNTPGQLFEIVVRSVPPLNIANPHGNISVKTSSTNTPVISFSAMSVVQPSVVINPPRVIIQDTQFTNDWPAKIVFRNGLNRPLQLSDVRVNVPGARVELRETEPGRAYEVSLVVPPSAKSAVATPELTLKSNFPDYASITVPILVVGANNAITAEGVPMTARANRFLSTPEGRRALAPKAADGFPIEGDGEDHTGHDHPPTAPK